MKKRWLGVKDDMKKGVAVVCQPGNLNLKELHHMHHMGIDRTFHLARKMDPEVTKEVVHRNMKCCDRCQSIDPAPSVHGTGDIQVGKNWKRLVIDVTHYQQKLYFSMVDCGPGRIAI